MIPFRVGVDDEAAARARAMTEFGGRMPYRFQSPDSWCGKVGEAKFLRWAGRSASVEEVDGREVGAPDFSVAGVPVDVKTLHRNPPGRPDPGWWAYCPLDQAGAGQAAELVFCSYSSGDRTLWIVGGMPKAEFLRRGLKVPRGRVIPPSLVASCDTCAVRYAELERPAAWLARVLREGRPAVYLGRRAGG